VLGFKVFAGGEEKKKTYKQILLSKKVPIWKSGILSLLLLKNRGRQGFERKTFRIESQQ
jgi:hypothetical protein